MPPRRPHARAFTLVELLVVIAVVAMLLVVLLPALGEARQTAKSLKCASNTRQMGIGMYTWGMDHKDRYPSHYWNPPRLAGLVSFAPRIRAYSEGVTEIFNCPSAPPEVWWTPKHNWTWRAQYVPMAATLGYDPVTRERPIFNYRDPDASRSPPQDVHLGFSYGYNDWGGSERAPWDARVRRQLGLGVEIDPPTDGKLGPIGFADVFHPSTMISIADSRGDGVWDTAIDPNSFEDNEWPSDRHFGGSNVVYSDGHAEFNRRDDLLRPTEHWRSRWNNDGQPHPYFW